MKDKLDFILDSKAVVQEESPAFAKYTLYLLLSILLFYLFKKYPAFINLSKVEWTLFSVGASIIFISFIWEFTSILIKTFI